jgi:cytochrome c553
VQYYARATRIDVLQGRRAPFLHREIIRVFIQSLRAVVFAAACLIALAAQSQTPEDAAVPHAPSDVPPPWAFVVDPPSTASPSRDDTPLHVPGSDRTYTAAQLNDSFEVADWHPKDHPHMPPVVAKGRLPAVYACGYCHLPNGAGRPENASLAGLSYAYILQQVAAFKSGERRAAVPDRDPARYMAIIAKAVRSSEVRAAARYFSRLPPQSRVHVVETPTVPHTHVAAWSLAVDTVLPREPIGRRIIEVPQNVEQFERRDSRTRYTAYVPLGSIRAGEALVRTGAVNVTLACTDCHGADLKGVGLIPRIIGRSPSYIVRELFDFQAGFRSGVQVAPMTEVAKNLRVDDMIAIASYLATLQ